VIPVQSEVSKLKLVKRLRVKLKLTEGVNEGLAVNEGPAVGRAIVGPAVGREIVGPGAVGRLIAGGLGRVPGLEGGLGLFPPPPPPPFRWPLATPT